MSSHSLIVELSQSIAANVQTLDAFLRQAKIRSPSFDEDAPKSMVLEDREMEAVRIQTLSAITDLHDLLQGPHAALTPMVNGTGLEAIYRWNIAAHVPLDGEISYAELADKVGLRKDMLIRIIRFSISFNRCFQEKRPGFVSHSAATRLLAESSDMYDTVGMMFDEGWHAFARTCDAIQLQNSGSAEPNKSAFSLAFCPDKTMWQFFDENPAKEKRFARSMEALAMRPGYSVASLVSGYPWSSLNPNATVVDIGGGQGHASIAISKANPNLKFIVQDLPKIIDGARKTLDPSITVSFMRHDFLELQTVQADVFLFRWVLHDWPDAYVVRILRNLIPVIQPGNKVVINDSCMPKLGEIPVVIERRVRQYDMCMLALFNSKERSAQEWRELFTEADIRFQDVKSWTPPGAALSIIEATWTESKELRAQEVAHTVS